MILDIFKKVPRKVGIAFSGGIDSVALLHALLARNIDVTLYTFDHGTVTSDQELEFANATARQYSLSLETARGTQCPVGASKEHWWSRQRNEWFQSAGAPIATGHHLQDAAEWYLMTALTGQGGYIMDYKNNNVCRPLLCVSKEHIVQYAESNNLQYISDPTNSDITFNKRNKVRARLLPAVLEVNPGFLNTIKRRIIQRERAVAQEIRFAV